MSSGFLAARPRLSDPPDDEAGGPKTSRSSLVAGPRSSSRTRSGRGGERAGEA